MKRKLGESPDQETADQAEEDGYSAGRYAGDGRIVRDMRNKHKGNKLTEQAFDRGFKKGLKEAK